MGLFKIWQESRGIMRLLIIQLICWIGWFSTFALAQFDISEGVTGSVTFPALGVTCVANLAVFATSLIRGRLDLEMGARDVLDILMSPKLFNISGIENGNGLTTYTGEDIEDADVVMLSNGRHNWSIRYFVKSNANFVKTNLLQILPWHDECEGVTVEACQHSCNCNIFQHSCNCIIFWTVERITNMLDRRMPQTLKRLSESLCLLPCGHCLINGCHGCNQEGLFHVDTSLPVVSQILDNISARISIRAGEPICICIPTKKASRDVWTKLLVKCFRSKDAEGRGVTVKASEALEGYLAGGRGGQEGSVEYNISSLMVPRFTEIIINLVLTFWFRVDGFSSALVARRTVRDYLVDTKGSGVAANAFLTKAEVKSDNNNTQVCQVLRFRGKLTCIIAFIPTGCVNLICSVGWALLISFERGADTSPPPTMPTVLLIITAIATAFGMDGAGLIITNSGILWDSRSLCGRVFLIAIATVFGTVFFVGFSVVALPVSLISSRCGVLSRGGVMFSGVITLQLVYIVAGSAVAGTLGIKGFGRWVYAALQLLIWMKWASGSIFLNDDISVEFFGRRLNTWGYLIYSSAFLLNAVLAGVRCTWEPWPWKDNELFSRNATSVHNHSVAA